MICST